MPYYGLSFPCSLVTQWQNAHLHPLTLCLHVTLKDNKITMLYALWTTPSVTVARNFPAHVHFLQPMSTVPKSEAEILNISKLP